MATAAGNLVVHLMAQTRQFEQGMKRSTQHTVSFRSQLSDMQSVAGRLHPALGTIANALTGPAGLAGAAVAVGYAFKRLMSESEGIVSTADRLGMGTEYLERLQDVAARTGTSFGTVATGWNKMKLEIARAQGGGGQADLFAQLGLDPGKLREMPAEQAFTLLAQAIGKIENPTDRARYQFELFGRSGMELNSVLARVAGGMNDINVVSEASRQKMADLENQWLDLKRSMTTTVKEGIVGVVVGFGGLRENMREMGALVGGGAEGLRNYIETRDRLARGGNGGATPGVSAEEALEQNRILERRGNIIESLTRQIAVLREGERAIQLREFRDMGGDVLELEKLMKEHTQLLDMQERQRRAADATKRAEQERLGVLQSLRDEAERLWEGADRFALRGLEGSQLEEAQGLQSQIAKMREQEDLQSRGRELTRSLETPVEAFARRFAELEKLAEFGAIDADTHVRALEKLRDEFGPEKEAEIAGPARFGGAMTAGSREAHSAILAAQGLGLDKPEKEVAKNTAKQIEMQAETNRRIGELIAQGEGAADIPPA